MIPTAPCFRASTTGSSRQLSEPSGSTWTKSCCRRPAPRSAVLVAAAAGASRRGAGWMVLLCALDPVGTGGVMLQQKQRLDCGRGQHSLLLPADAVDAPANAVAAAAPAIVHFGGPNLRGAAKKFV